MIPSTTWFPTSLSEQAIWFSNFESQLTNYSATLSITPAEMATLGKDNQDVQSIALTTAAVETYRSSVRQFRISLLEDPVGSAAPVFPFENFGAPPNAQPAGVFERLDILVRKIKGSPAYNEEIGEALRIIPRTAERPPVGTTPPELKLATLPGNVVTVTFKRGNSDGINIETRIDNSAWTAAGGFFKSPVSLSIPPSESGTPRYVEVRARYLSGNTPVGDNSAIQAIATTP